MTTQIEILGRTVSGDVDDTIRSWLYADWIVPSAAADTERFPSSSFTISLVTSSRPVPPEIVVADAAVGPLGSRHLGIGDDEFWVLETVEGRLDAVHGALDDEGATITLHGTPFGGTIALRNAIVEALAASGIIRLHAAAIHDGSNTLALLGPTGRGKSTTMLRAVIDGWKPIAEDACLLDPSTMRIVGADRTLRLRPGALTALGPTPGGFEPQPSADGRHEIDYEQLGGRVPSADLTHLVRLVRTSSRHARWAPLDTASAVMALHQTTGIANSDRVRRLNASQFGKIVRRTTNIELELGAPTSPIPPLTGLD